MEEIAPRSEATRSKLVIRFEVMASRFEAIAVRLEVMAISFLAAPADDRELSSLDPVRSALTKKRSKSICWAGGTSSVPAPSSDARIP